MGLGANLREARRYLRLSQSVVAEVIGVQRQAVAAYEREKRAPDAMQLTRMANLYRVSLDELVRTSKAVAPLSDAPSHLARGGVEGLDAEDQAELTSFHRYLRNRKPFSAVSFEAARFATLAERTTALRTACGVSDSAPVPVLAILAKLGAEVRFTGLSKLSGALILPTEGEEHPPGVLVNSDQPYERQRFSAAHELAHLVLEHNKHTSESVSRLGRRFHPDEVAADSFAAELLMPVDLLHSRLQGTADESLDVRVFELAQTFLVSFQAMVVRLSKIGMLPRPVAKHLRELKPSEISQKVGLQAARSMPFDPNEIPDIAVSSMPEGWEQRATPDLVRMLQENVYTEYIRRSSEDGAPTGAGDVYSAVARWVADTFPIVG